jgi:hypothetical protein
MRAAPRFFLTTSDLTITFPMQLQKYFITELMSWYSSYIYSYISSAFSSFSLILLRLLKAYAENFPLLQ